MADREGLIRELERTVAREPRSGREALAHARALRLLERMTRGRRPVPPCPPGWHPAPGTEWEELDRAYLDQNPEVRERWWRNLEGGR